MRDLHPHRRDNISSRITEVKIMDTPITPAEEFADALRSLVVSLGQLREALEILACEMIVTAEGPPAPRAGSPHCIVTKER